MQVLLSPPRSCHLSSPAKHTGLYLVHSPLQAPRSFVPTSTRCSQSTDEVGGTAGGVHLWMIKGMHGGVQ